MKMKGVSGAGMQAAVYRKWRKDIFQPSGYRKIGPVFEFAEWNSKYENKDLN